MRAEAWLGCKKQFSKWLARNGAEVFIDQLSFFAFRASRNSSIEGQITIANDQTYANFTASDAWLDFKSGQKWRHNTTTPKHCSATRKRVKEFLLDRDGNSCVFCGKPIDGPSTIEHLLDRSSGGSNAYANLALAHELCNKEAGDLKILRQKIEHIIRKRSC